MKCLRYEKLYILKFSKNFRVAWFNFKCLINKIFTISSDFREFLTSSNIVFFVFEVLLLNVELTRFGASTFFKATKPVFLVPFSAFTLRLPFWTLYGF